MAIVSSHISPQGGIMDMGIFVVKSLLLQDDVAASSSSVALDMDQIERERLQQQVKGGGDRV